MHIRAVDRHGLLGAKCTKKDDENEISATEVATKHVKSRLGNRSTIVVGGRMHTKKNDAPGRDAH